MSHQNTGEYLTAPGRFAYLLKALHRQTEKPVVVLVDEYDKPILDALEIPEVARANRNFLRGLYGMIKSNDAPRPAHVPHGGEHLLRPESYRHHPGPPLQRRVSSVSLEEMIGTEDLLSTFDVNRIGTEALLFQTGYLTITAEEELGGEPHAFFASIPYQWYAARRCRRTNHHSADYEGFYASVFYSYFAAFGYEIAVEESRSHGRLDMAVRTGGHVYLFEFKVVEMTPPGSALAQLQERPSQVRRVDRVPRPRFCGTSRQPSASSASADPACDTWRDRHATGASNPTKAVAESPVRAHRAARRLRTASRFSTCNASSPIARA